MSMEKNSTPVLLAKNKTIPVSAMSSCRQNGFGVLAWLLMIPAILLMLLALALLFYEGRKAYWDEQVKEMCGKDGGVQIIEKVRISRSVVNLLGVVDGKISVVIKELAHPRAPVYTVNKMTVIREANPNVWRSEWEMVRRADQKIVARWVSYSRSGGDFPVGLAQDSRFTCPNLKVITSDIQQLFVVEEDAK